jgi:cytochrome c
MRKTLAVVIPLGLALGTSTAIAVDRPGLGKLVTEADLNQWDISIAPDGAALPPGSGTPDQGAVVYAQKCELCHGKEGQGGRSAALSGPKRTVANYVPYATTIFDYTRRAMPWQQPKSLTNDEVYAVTAYILALNKIIGEKEVMNAEALPKVHMPNRDGFVSRYPLSRTLRRCFSCSRGLLCR